MSYAREEEREVAVTMVEEEMADDFGVAVGDVVAVGDGDEKAVTTTGEKEDPEEDPEVEKALGQRVGPGENLVPEGEEVEPVFEKEELEDSDEDEASEGEEDLEMEEVEEEDNFDCYSDG